MGNFRSSFHVKHPDKDKIYTIIDNEYTISEEIPKTVYGQGAKVKIIGTKDLLCSRPNLPKITCSMVQFQNGNIDVYFSNSLKAN